MKIGTIYPIIEDNWQVVNTPLLSAGFDHFELLPENEHGFSINKLKKILRRYEILIHAPFIEANLISSSEIIRNASVVYYKTNLTPLVRTFAPKVVTLHVGYSAFYYSALVFDQLGQLIKQIPQIAVENMPSNNNIWKIAYPCTEKCLDSLLISLQKPRYTFDVGHWMKQGYDVYRLVEKYIKYIVNIYIHDTAEGKDHQPLGTGHLDVKRFISILKKNDYQHYLTIEMASDNPQGALDSFKILKQYII